MRLACAYTPQLALQAVLRRSPDWLQNKQQAIVLAAGPGERARVVGLTTAALQAGLHKGITVNQARAMGSARLNDRLTVMVRSETDTVAAQSALADVGFSFAPRVEVEPGRVFFEIGDLMQLYPEGEADIARAIAARAARLGLSVRVSVAGSKGIARVASRAGLSGEHILVPSAAAQAAEFLAPLPLQSALHALGKSGDEDTASAEEVRTMADLTERLSRWGVRTIGALAALPMQDVALRLGESGARLRRLAAGRDEEPFAPTLPPDAVLEGTEFDYALETLEPLAFVLRGLVDRVLTRLACRSLACAGLTLRLKLDPRGFDVRDLELGAPTREAQTLLQLLRLDIARRPPSAPVIGAEILARPARVRAVQLDFLRPAGPGPERLAATLARLTALVGPQNVGAPDVADGFKEEDCHMIPWTWRPTPDAPTALVPQLGIRRYRPPQPIQVLMGREGPSAMQGKGVSARILVAAGPYRTSNEWWKEEGWSRDHWDVHASDGALYRLHQDRLSGAWFVDGYYD